MDPIGIPDVAGVEESLVAASAAHPRPAAAVDQGGAGSPIAVLGTTFAGRVTLWSANAQSLFGWSAEEAVGRPLTELLDLGLTPAEIAELLFVGSVGAWTRDVSVTDRSGRRTLLRLTATLAVGPDGIDEIVCTLRPVPATPSGGTAERPLRTVAERGSDLVLVCGQDLTVNYAGPSLYRTFGYRARDVIGTPGWRYVHPLDRAALRRHWQAALTRPAEPQELELRVRDADGGWRWVQLRISNLSDDQTLSAMVLDLRDVSETRRLADRLAAGERLLHELLQTALEGVWVLDPTGKVLLANARMAELLGVDASRLVGSPAFDLVDPVTAGFLRHRLTHRSTGAREQYEFSFIRPDGSRRWVRASGAPRYGPSGGYLGSIETMHDITDRKRLEAELQRRGRPDAEPRLVAERADQFAGVPGLDRLSRREFEVVRLLLRGDRVPVIARQLFVSQSTVRNHLSSVFRKLRVTSQQELIVLLRERRLPG